MSLPQEHDLVLEASNIGFDYPSESDGRGFHLSISRLEVYSGETLALCGPSGSGKSTLLAILAGLLRPKVGEVWHSMGQARENPYACSARDWRRRRQHLGFVHQDPREFLNDRRIVAEIVADPLNIHGLMRKRDRREHAATTLQEVGITRAQAERTPGALSGGQRQRVAIARAMIARPRLIFLDEPTSALDVSVQAAIVVLLRQLRAASTRTAFVLVTHDLALVRQLADRVIVLDHGHVAESGHVDQVLDSPTSQVTASLLGSG